MADSAFVTTRVVLGADVAQNGTFTVSYPNSLEGGAFAGGVYHQMIANQRLYNAPVDFTIAFNQTSATITWKGANTLTAGTEVYVQLDQAGENLVAGVNRASRASVIRVDLGSPTASNDAALRANATYTGGAGAITLLAAGQTFDVPRNVIITSSGDDSAKTFTVVGKDEYGVAVSEVITGANAGVAAGVKAFKSVTSVTASGNAAANLKIGFGNVLGLPVHLPYTGAVLKELMDSASATAGTLVNGLSPLTASTTTTADVRGTYVPNTAPNGAHTYSLVIATANPTFLGSPQA